MNDHPTSCKSLNICSNISKERETNVYAFLVIYALNLSKNVKSLGELASFPEFLLLI